MSNEETSFDDIKQRLEEIVDQVSEEDIDLDEALTLYEEAVKLGLAACDASEIADDSAEDEADPAADSVRPDQWESAQGEASQEGAGENVAEPQEGSVQEGDEEPAPQN